MSHIAANFFLFIALTAGVGLFRGGVKIVGQIVWILLGRSRTKPTSFQHCVPTPQYRVPAIIPTCNPTLSPNDRLSPLPITSWPRPTPKERMTLHLIHPPSHWQRPPPPAFQCCIPVTIAHTSPLTSHCPHPRSHQRVLLSSQHRRSCKWPTPTHLPAAFQTPKESLMGRLIHPASLPSDRPHLHPNATSQQLSPTHALSLHCDYLHQRVASSIQHRAQRPSPLTSQWVSPTHALSHRSKHLHPTNSRQALLYIFSALCPSDCLHPYPSIDHPHMPCRFPVITCTQQVVEQALLSIWHGALAATITHTHTPVTSQRISAPNERPTGPLVLFSIASQRLSLSHPSIDHPHSMPCCLPMTVVFGTWCR